MFIPPYIHSDIDYRKTEKFFIDYCVVPAFLHDLDLIILDIKASNKEFFKKITQIDKLEETIKFLNTCQEKNIPVIIRQVIVPNINDTKENILELKEFLKNYTNIIKIELLPYHTMAKDKYRKLNIPYTLNNTNSLSIEKLEELNQYLV